MWEFSQQAEKDIVAAARTARALAGAGLLLIKVMDGLDWMELYDSGGYGSPERFESFWED